MQGFGPSVNSNRSGEVIINNSTNIFHRDPERDELTKSD
jgi:hypothetical protein